MEDDTLLFSDYHSQVFGFQSSTSETERRDVQHKEIATDPPPATAEANTTTNAHIEIGIQTSSAAWSASDGTKARLFDEHKLAAWLSRIYPMVEQELILGPTPVSPLLAALSVNDTAFQAVAHQIIRISGGDTAAESFSHGCAAWMSVATGTAPVLAVAGSRSHSAWCDHNDATAQIFRPQRNRSTGDIVYMPFRTVATKGCVQTMAANPHDRDQLAVGTYSGNVTVWLYERKANEPDDIVEVLGDAGAQYGSVVGLAWLPPPMRPADEYRLLSAHADGMVVMWRIVTTGRQGSQMLRDKIFIIKSHRNAKETARLSAICALSGDQFAIGTEDGRVYICSISRAVLTTSGTSPNRVQLLPKTESQLNPIVGELSDAHRFAVTSLQTADSTGNAQGILISSDVSGEVFYRGRTTRSGDELLDTGEAPWQVLRLPLKVRKHFACTRDGRCLLAAGNDGALEVFSVSGQPARQSVSGQCSGLGCSAVALSDNQNWIICGLYDDRAFQLFVAT